MDLNMLHPDCWTTQINKDLHIAGGRMKSQVCVAKNEEEG